MSLARRGEEETKNKFSNGEKEEMGENEWRADAHSLPGIYASSSDLFVRSLFPKVPRGGGGFDKQKMPKIVPYFLQSPLCFGGKRDEIRSSNKLVNLEGGSSANEKLWPPLHSFSLSLQRGWKGGSCRPRESLWS